MKYIKRLIFWGGLIAFVVGGIFSAQYLPEYLATGTFKPGLRLLDGTPVDGISQIVPNNVKAVILVYFSAKCDACHEQLALMKTLHRPPVFVVGVNIGDSQRAVEKLVNELDLNYPVLIGLRPSEAVELSGQPLKGVPYTFLSTAEDYAAWYGAGLPDEAKQLLGALE